ILIFNTGTTPGIGHEDVADMCDIMLDHEGTAPSGTYSYTPPTYHDTLDEAQRAWHALYSVPTLNYPTALTTTRSKLAGWVDVTDAGGYSVLPSYLDGEVDRVKP